VPFDEHIELFVDVFRDYVKFVTLHLGFLLSPFFSFIPFQTFVKEFLVPLGNEGWTPKRDQPEYG
jgi:hypothetical protein